jgi:hypothetical protein
LVGAAHAGRFTMSLRLRKRPRQRAASDQIIHCVMAAGEFPALVKAFLKTDRFVLTSPNAYNQLGLGTTQLYNKRVVYNQKRHGTFPLGNRLVTF